MTGHHTMLATGMREPRISACIPCPHTGGPCLPGHAMLRRLIEAIGTADEVVSPDFEMRGTLTMTDCINGCAAAWLARKDKACFVGALDEAAATDDLLERARDGDDPDPFDRDGHHAVLVVEAGIRII